MECPYKTIAYAQGWDRHYGTESHPDKITVSFGTCNTTSCKACIGLKCMLIEKGVPLPNVNIKF